MRRILLTLAGGLTLAAVAATWGSGQANPPDALMIRPEAGEWLILAASYSGPEAVELATQLATLVRTEHSMPAYVFNYADEERKRMKEELDRAYRANPALKVRRRTIRVEEHCAVLVGGWEDMEDARKTLDRVRKLPLPKLELRSGKVPYDQQWIVEPVKGSDQGRIKLAEVNPFHTAFVTRNPTLRKPQAREENKHDPFLKKLNANEEYSLLQCPKPWTLAVKQYTGVSMLQGVEKSEGLLDKIWPWGKQSGETLNASAMQAHELARVLRKLSFDAYVLHTRHSSVVTIGGFDRVDDPAVQRARQQILTLVEQVRSANNGNDPLQLFANPMPMEVPKF